METNISMWSTDMFIDKGVDIAYARYIHDWIVYPVACPIILLFGIVTNIINIMCFFKQGFSDQINISLLGMAVSDLGSLVTLIGTTIGLSLPFGKLDLPFDPIEVQYLVASLPHTVLTRISAWITAFIAMERCLCIAIPLKVKYIITNNRVSIIVVTIFIVNIAGQIPVYTVNSLGWKYFSGINKSLVGIVYSAERASVEPVSYLINNVLLNFLAFVVIVVCTIVLSVQLHKQAKWRMASTQAVNVSDQNKKVAKLVIAVSVIFIVCFIPNCFVFILMSSSSDFSVKGRYKDILFMIAGGGVILESINSSMNIVVYYRMSTKYRDVCKGIFSFGKV